MDRRRTITGDSPGERRAGGGERAACSPPLAARRNPLATSLQPYGRRHAFDDGHWIAPRATAARRDFEGVGAGRDPVDDGVAADESDLGNAIAPATYILLTVGLDQPRRRVEIAGRAQQERAAPRQRDADLARRH